MVMLRYPTLLQAVSLPVVILARSAESGLQELDKNLAGMQDTEIADTIEDLTSFDKYLPISYRALILITFGIWLWYINLRVCAKFNIDVTRVLKFSTAEVTSQQLITKTREVLVKCTLATLVNYSIYFFFISNGFQWNLLSLFPLFGVGLIFFFMIYPVDSSDKKRLLATIQRTLVGKIDINIRNNDILLADTLTSYNRVVLDFMVYLSALILGISTLPSDGTSRSVLKRDHATVYSLDLIIGLYPSMIRLKQCLFEFAKSGRRNNQHLLNAIKYSTAALPVLGNIIIRLGSDYESLGLFVWYLGSFVNSTYSLIWDIQMDWNFEMFSRFMKNGQGKEFLRKKLLFNFKFYYYCAIVVDIMLRYIWVCRWLFPVSPSSRILLSILYSSEVGHFTLEILEIFRRWVWVFIKIETEYIKMISETSNSIELQNLV